MEQLQQAKVGREGGMERGKREGGREKGWRRKGERVEEEETVGRVSLQEAYSFNFHLCHVSCPSCIVQLPY